MQKYEVQEFCLFGGWTNTWTTDDEPIIYDTAQEAQIALDDFFYQCEEAVEDGNMEDVPSRYDFKIVEVSNER